VCEVADEGRAEATGDDAGHGEPRHTLSTTPSRRDRSLDCDTDREKEVARVDVHPGESVDRCDVSGIPQTQASVLCVSTHWPMRQE
jgi:hypothetical protein